MVTVRACATIHRVTEVETGVLAARLLGVSALVFLAPGLAFLSVLRVPAEWPERVVLAFSLSFSWIFILSVVVPLSGWTVAHALLATLVLVSGLTVATVTRRWRHRGGISAGRPGAATTVVIAFVIASCVAGWVIESPFTGEEALDFVSLSRFADGGPITFDNTSLLPDTPPVYLFQPYQLALGMIARWSGADPLVAFIKFRAFLAPLGLLCVYALLRRLTLTRAEAVAAFVVVVLFVALEIETWERNALFPFVRRQGFSIAVLVPSLLVLCIIATRRTQEDGGRLLRRVALGVMPLMLAASLSTHAIEMVPCLFYAGATIVAILTGLDRSGDRKAAMVMGVALALSAGAYMQAHSQAVSYITAPGNSRRGALGEQLDRVVTSRGDAPGWASVTGDNLFVGATPLTTAAVLGIPALGLAALRAPTAAAALALGTVPLALLHANPAGTIALRWLVSPGTMRDTTAYFMIVGVLGAALGLVALAQAVLTAAVSRPGRRGQVLAGAVLVLLILLAGQAAILWLGNLASIEPRLFLLVQAAIAAAVVTLAAMRPRPLLKAAPSGSVTILAACLAAPLGVPGLAIGGAFEREANASVYTRFTAARSHPSTLDWPVQMTRNWHKPSGRRCRCHAPWSTKCGAGSLRGRSCSRTRVTVVRSSFSWTRIASTRSRSTGTSSGRPRATTPSTFGRRTDRTPNTPSSTRARRSPIWRTGSSGSIGYRTCSQTPRMPSRLPASSRTPASACLSRSRCTATASIKSAVVIEQDRRTVVGLTMWRRWATIW